MRKGNEVVFSAIHSVWKEEKSKEEGLRSMSGNTQAVSAYRASKTGEIEDRRC